MSTISSLALISSTAVMVKLYLKSGFGGQWDRYEISGAGNQVLVK
jgi:hypothetical protein